MTTVADLRREGRALLAASPAHTGPREATLLLGRVLGLSEAQLLARPGLQVGEPDRARYRALLARRARGEPVAYLLGSREFFGRSFLVDRRVLIPRPETEHLVAAALAEVGDRRAVAVDVGTGSGCVAITLALEAPAVRVVASDLSLAALALARSNARRLAAERATRFVAADLLAGLDLRAIDLVVSNPPYVDPGAAATLPPDVREHEPPSALFAPQGGLGHLRRLLAAARDLRSGAALIVEIGAGQAEAVVALASEALEVEGVDRDYAGIERVVRMRRVARRR
ncbi:MAG TPA: peptide chain release factor N(5)-glutamine methyltransferase [Thermoanaerobaculia bacterium]|nr:peptide chain release factor N(5)-glutamine methyltransferase [Thermoanaerobaculia bacterium]